MTMQWIEEPRQLGSQNNALGASAVVATSGIVPALVVLGVVGLAIYGVVKLSQREGLAENPTCPPCPVPVRRRRRRHYKRRVRRRPHGSRGRRS